jgi:hypothetical protein
LYLDWHVGYLNVQPDGPESKQKEIKLWDVTQWSPALRRQHTPCVGVKPPKARGAAGALTVNFTVGGMQRATVYGYSLWEFEVYA